MNETKEKIIKALEAIGLKHNKDFTVRHRYCGYSEALTVCVKNVKYDLETVERQVKVFEYYERDIDYEILQGGNTFIRVEYAKNKETYETIFEEYARNTYGEKAKELIAKMKKPEGNELVKIYENKDCVIAAYNDYQLTMVEGCWAKDWNERFYRANLCEQAIAEIIAHIELGHFNQRFHELTKEEYIAEKETDYDTKEDIENQLAKRKAEFEKEGYDWLRYCRAETGYYDLAR